MTTTRTTIHRMAVDAPSVRCRYRIRNPDGNRVQCRMPARYVQTSRLQHEGVESTSVRNLCLEHAQTVADSWGLKHARSLSLDNRVIRLEVAVEDDPHPGMATAQRGDEVNG